MNILAELHSVILIKRFIKKSIISIDSQKGPILKKIFSLYSTGNYSLESLSNKLEKLGLLYAESLSKFPKSVLHRILRNPMYFGAFRFRGDIFEGNHPPLITENRFKRVQQQFELNAHGKKILSRRRWLYRGLIRCGYCVCIFTAEMHKGKYIYYHCTHSKGHCKNKKFIRSEVIKLLQKFNFDKTKL